MRIDDDLHAKLKRRAAQEGLSVNALVNEILAREVAAGDRRATLRMRARATGRLVLPQKTTRTPSRQEIESGTRGAGRAVSEALAAERAAR